MDFSQFLAEKTDTILDKWVRAVRKDQRIESADDLSYTAIKNHIPNVLKAMVTVLSKSEDNDIQSIIVASFEHGAIRAEQGFDATEIAREYHLLRTVIFDTIHADLLKGTPAEIIRSMRLIDAIVDEAIARCFKSYLEERLRELRQLQTSLTLHNQELTRLISANQEYISQLAHELKHPLTSIIGYSDLFLRQQRRKSKVKDNYTNLEHIERVLRNGRQLLHLINDVLELSRYDAGQIKLQLAPTNVPELINNVYEMLEPLAVEKNLQIVVDCDRAPQELITDSFQLQQIVTNLISNAIRYTESGTIIVMCQVLEKQRWAIAVSDTGIGIAPEDQGQIFEPYFRVSAGDRPYLPDSTGLGLAIVWRLVKLLQGEINLVSEVGVGSTFTVILPLELEI
ncbi:MULTISPECIES: HAMP domain-containing sensor histidine kinase [Nostoc]|uniref:histidine kinase n=1 Tax=Nostoc paludosum FACHB-159 TaxID=2692908 RepID=A0ABR8K0W7_9NOSO|nr:MULTISPECIES: HAMP domain-containing sensor histidine kinase [Nostoc]MBD2676125.1 HAMP domain-containing histidine kinase [Nostoc sp. FACHB-857]MBD2732745.1 HAMP domain-containing histidine kinase [Nostoc paludosum FACHB-159]